MNETIDRSFLSLSIIDLSKDELQKEYANIRTHLLNAQKELEDKNQEIYNYKRKISTCTVLESEYQAEIEILRSEVQDVRKLQMKVESLEDEMAKMQDFYSEQLEENSAVLRDKDVKLKNLQEELEVLMILAKTGNVEQLDKLSVENIELKQKILLLNEEFLEQHKLLMAEKLEVDKQIAINTEEMNCMQENLKLKREELEEAKVQIEKYQEDLMLLKNEVDLHKNKPLSLESRGNSLFAEVNDKRVQLQKDMKMMKTQYVQMQKERNSVLRKVNQLQAENFTLSKRWEKDILEKSQHDYEVEETYKIRIATLELSLGKLKQEASAYIDLKFGTDKEANMSAFRGLVEIKRQIIKDLHDRLDKECLNQMLLSQQLSEVKREKQSWRCTASKYSCEIGLLKCTIDELKNDVSLAVPKQEHKKECHEQHIKNELILDDKKSEAGSIEIDSMKENVMKTDLRTQSRKEWREQNGVAVTFSADTKEPSTNQVRQKGRILQCKPTYVYSKPKPEN